jgi:hypothetical protein
MNSICFSPETERSNAGRHVGLESNIQGSTRTRESFLTTMSISSTRAVRTPKTH